jgi:hypothetical protein
MRRALTVTDEYQVADYGDKRKKKLPWSISPASQHPWTCQPNDVSEPKPETAAPLDPHGV